MKWNPVRLSPAEYVNEAGILRQLRQILSAKGYQKPLVLTDQRVIQATRKYLPAGFYEQECVLLFAGSCTDAEAQRITQSVKDEDVIIALGGGQLLDTAKIVAAQTKTALINIPTVPSNCAAITTKSMIYTEKAHELCGRKRHAEPVNLVLVDPLLLRHAPKQYLLSGIGDTLAKWYEIRRRLNVPAAQGAILEIARKAIEITRERTLAISDLDKLDEQTFSALLDTIFLVAASVDGFAAARGRSVAAHSFHNSYLKAVAHPVKTHGEIVAFGVLVQLAIEAEYTELAELLEFYQRIGLPTQLAELKLQPKTAVIHAIATEMVAPTNLRIQTVYPNLSEAKVFAAINSLGGARENAI